MCWHSTVSTCVSLNDFYFSSSRCRHIVEKKKKKKMKKSWVLYLVSESSFNILGIYVEVRWVRTVGSLSKWFRQLNVSLDSLGKHLRVTHRFQPWMFLREKKRQDHMIRHNVIHVNLYLQVVNIKLSRNGYSFLQFFFFFLILLLHTSSLSFSKGTRCCFNISFSFQYFKLDNHVAY